MARQQVGSDNGWQPKFNDTITLRHREGVPAMGGWVPVGGTVDRFRATMAALLDRHGFRWAATDGNGAECIRCVHCTGGFPRGVPDGDRVDFRRVLFTKSVAPIKANRALHYVLLRGLPAVEDAKTNGYHKASMQHFITAKMIAEANFVVTSRNAEAVKGIGKVHPQRAPSRITLRPSRCPQVYASLVERAIKLLREAAKGHLPAGVQRSDDFEPAPFVPFSGTGHVLGSPPGTVESGKRLRDSDKRELRAKAALGRLQGAGSSSSEGGEAGAMPVETMHDFIDLLSDCESEEE